MNTTISLDTSKTTQSAIGGANQHVTSQAAWPFDPSSWNELTAPIYEGMDKRARFEMARPLREKAMAGMPMTAWEHLLYALLKGKSPFKAFSPFRGRRAHEPERMQWEGLLSAVRGVELHLNSLSGVLYVNKDLVQQLRQLLLMTKLRAMALSVTNKQPEFVRQVLAEAMDLTPQGAGTVMDHCKKAADMFKALTGYLYFGDEPVLPVPKWAEAYREKLGDIVWEHRKLMHEYLSMHDCGKPFCLVFDAEGRAHFPNHAIVSGTLWLAAGGTPQAASLMAQDMDLHTLKAEDVEAFAKRPDAALLLLSGIASLHANADDFGGVESDSFKIKLKRLQSRGQRICDLLLGA